MDINQAYEKIGVFGPAQYRFALPLMLGGNIFLGFCMCLGIFTLYTNKENDPIQISSVVEEFDLTDFEAKLINSALMFGVLSGNSIVGKLSDTYGRKPVTMVLVPIVLSVIIFSTFLTFDWVTYAFWRFLCGVSAGGLGVTTSVLTLELVGNEYWGYMCIGGSFFFAIGIFLLALIAKIFTSWRLLTLATALPNIYLIYVVYKTPESPRWLYSIGKVAEAEKIIKMIGKINGKSDLDLNRIKLRNTQNSSLTSSVRSNSSDSHDNFVTSNNKVEEGGLDIFKSRPTRIRMLVMMITWFSTSLIYYGLTLGAGDLGDNIYENTTFSGLAELPGYVLAIVMMEHPIFARKRTLLSFFLVTFMFTGMIDLFSLHQNSRLILALLAKMLISGVFAIIYTYCCELFPTTVRSLGLGWSSMSARIGGILAPFAIQVGSLLVKNDDNSGFLLYSVFSLISFFSLFLVPETLNSNLFDSIKDLEKFSRRQINMFDDNIEAVGLLED